LGLRRFGLRLLFLFLLLGLLVVITVRLALLALFGAVVVGGGAVFPAGGLDVVFVILVVIGPLCTFFGALRGLARLFLLPCLVLLGLEAECDMFFRRAL